MRELIMSIDKLAKTLLSSRRKGLFSRKPIFERYAKVSHADLTHLEEKVGLPIPAPLRGWLLEVGYGDINEDMSFREEWFATIEAGQLSGGAIFARDVLGNFYAFDVRGQIYFVSRHEAVFSKMSEDFSGFIEELTLRNYDLTAWVDDLKTQEYHW